MATTGEVTKWSYSHKDKSYTSSKSIAKNKDGYAVATDTGRQYQYDYNGNLSVFSGFSTIVNKYIGGKIASSISHNGKHKIGESYNYDSRGELKEKVIEKTKVVYERDDNSRLRSKKIFYEDQLISDISLEYSEDGLHSISGAIEKIEYHDKNVIKAITYINGATLNTSYLNYPKAYVDEMTFKSGNNQTLYSSKYTYNNVKHLSSKAIFRPLFKSKIGSEELTKYEYEYHETNSSVRLESTERNGRRIDHKFSKFERDKFGNVTKIGAKRLTWNKGTLSKIGRINLYFDQGNQLKSVYDSNRRIFQKIDDDTLQYKSRYITKVVSDNKLLGVYIDRKFYPVITDHLGSIIGMYSESHEELLWYREYDEWGNKRVWNNRKFSNSKALENTVLWGYAGLISIPEIKKLYFAEHRIYSPKIGEWLSPDPLVTWSPDSIIKQPGNWNPFEYAMGNPVNFVDTSGYSSMHSQFVGYMTAGIGDIAHVVHYHGMSAINFARGIANSTFTGGGLRPSANLGIMKMSGRFGADSYRGAEAFIEGQFKGGHSSYIGQFGYSNGGIRALGRIEPRFGSSAGGLTFGTSNSLRFKTEIMGFGLQYNTDLSGRLDLKVMGFRGGDLGVYFNLHLTDSSLQFFNQATSYQDWAFRTLPYGGQSF
ncbi:MULTISPECIES: RHS repeat-associated core domain-containing protein [unclassified Pseudoalteromonas]|uniref:RHS repeat-associated core domain-containing protein n=1 Tax=unclassified Pseudoalteromonas TaxID=194690 RepID=UPI0005AB0EFF|nr:MULTISPECIES: RHS repeat-associated core domain-containing protein [unclassified Pseudoalteromonas]